MMKLVLAVVMLVMVMVAVTARYEAKCREAGGEQVTVTPVKHPVGRITVRYCGTAAAEATHWKLDLTVMRTVRRPEDCNEEEAGFRRGTLHSPFSERLHHNCSNVCMSRSLDLVWAGCYKLYTQLLRGDDDTFYDHSSYYYVNHTDAWNDSVTSPQYFTHSKQYFNFEPAAMGGGVLVTWLTGRVPIDEYEIKLLTNQGYCKKCDIKSSNVSSNEDVTGNCSLVQDTRPPLQCRLWLNPGCHQLLLHHKAPWTSHIAYQDLINPSASLCYEGPPPESLVIEKKAGMSAAVAMSLAALSLALVALAGVAVWRRWRHMMRKPSLGNKDTPLMCVPPSPPPPPPRVLVLYARETEPGMRVVHALIRLLQAATHGEVCDLYSPETVTEAAGAMSAWLRGQLTSQRTRVLLLQTPAMAALYSTVESGGADGDALVPSPVYCLPHTHDPLLPLSVRLLSEAAVPTPQPYLRYFVATLSSLPTEVVPHVVPFTRYSLPGAALVLLKDLTDQLTLEKEPLQHELQAFESAVDEFIEYVRSNENYLQELLRLA